MKARTKPGRRKKDGSVSPIQILSLTPYDHVTHRLVSILDAGAGTPGDVILRAGWVPLVPARLERGSSLWFAADMFVRCWINARRAKAAAAVETEHQQEQADRDDISSYNAAIRSVGSALKDEHQAYKTETLAAVALLFLCEDEMNVCRGRPGNCHEAGICALLDARGLPDRRDELDTRLAFELMAGLLPHLIDAGEPAFLQQTGWMKHMEEALETPNGTTISDDNDRPSYRLTIYFAHWIRLASKTRDLLSQSQPSAEDADRLVADAQDVCSLLEAFESSNEQLSRLPLWRLDDQLAYTIPDQGQKAYEFDDWLTCEVLCLHAAVSLAATLMLCSALRIAGASSEAPTRRLYSLSHRVWMAMPYALRQLPSRKLVAATALIMSIEQAAEINHQLALALAAQASELLQERWPPALQGANASSLAAVASLMATSRRLTGRSGDVAELREMLPN